jgi:hypothetical protein
MIFISIVAIPDGNQRPVLDASKIHGPERLLTVEGVVDVKVCTDQHGWSIRRIRMKSQNYSRDKDGSGVRCHTKGNVRILGTDLPVIRRKLDSLLA